MLRLPYQLLAAVLVLLAGTFWVTDSQAVVPPFLVQQGRLLDSSGDPVSGETTFEFSLYDAEDAESPLWTETQAITLDDGFFSTLLGEETALDPALFNGTILYLGVKVGADDEMTPRQALTSVPYSLKAGVADNATTADAVEWTGISGFPSPCPSPQFLRGYEANGDAVCGDPQSLSCTTRIFNGTTASASVACQSGEVLTGGGCYAPAGQTLSASNPYQPCSGLCILCSVPDGGESACAGSGWNCVANGGIDTWAYARCCSLD